MNESALKDLANEQTPVYTALRGLISSINFINIGVISNVHNENYVDVSLYYTDSTGQKVVIQAVRLLHIGTTKCKINITPAVGDNVILLCPKDFVETLQYNKPATKGETSYLPYGNINMCGILIKDESDDNVKTTIGIDAEGNISVSTKGDVSVNSDKTIKFDGDGFGGLCKTVELKNQLEILSGRLDAVIDGLENSSTTAEDGGAAYKSGITAIIEAYGQKEDFSQIENTKVKHGDGSSS